MKRFLSLCLALIVAVGICLSAPVTIEAEAASWPSDYRYWQQGASDDADMRNYGCWVVADAKMIYEAGINRSSSFNPDVLKDWYKANGFLNSGFAKLDCAQAPVKYAKSLGNSNLKFLGETTSNIQNKIFENVNKGYFTIAMRSDEGHYFMIDNASTKKYGKIWIYNSWRTTNSHAPMENTYSIGKIYTYSYTSSGTSTPSLEALKTPVITFDKSSYTMGDTIKISWVLSPSNSNLSHYWINVTNPAGNFDINEKIDKSQSTFSFATPGVGTYKVTLFATPYGSVSGEGSMTDTKSITINPKVTTYSITYNANGGSGAPAPQTKENGVPLTLSTQVPVRDGYDFLLWVDSTSSFLLSGYKPGDTYTKDKDVTLYAYWQCNHSLGTTIVNAKEPTYTETGYTGDTKCNTCGAILSNGTSVPVLTLGVPTVKATNAANGINVNWNSVDGAEKYIVYRKTYNDSTKIWGGWETLTTDCTATSYVDTKALLGVYYKYTAVAVAGDTQSSFVSSSVLKRDVAPTVKINNKASGVNVTWNSVYGAQKYTVYRKAYNDSTKAWSSWETLTSNCTTTSYTDAKALFGVKYMYTVVAVRNGVNSSFVASGTLQRDVAPVVKVANANAGINVTWKSVYGAQKYTVYRKVYNATTKTWGSWETVVSNCTTTSYTDTKALVCEKYKYTVAAVRGNFSSTFVETTLIQRDIAPVVKVANANAGINVTWNSVYGAQSYIVYRKTYNATTKAWSSWELLKNNCTTTSYTDTKALLGVKYMYTAVAVRNGAKSSFVASKELQRNTSPVVAVKNITTGIKVTWNSVYGAQKYTVYRKTYNATKKTWSSWESLSNNCTSTSYVDKKALYNAKCMYTVVAERNNVRSTFVASDAVKCNIVPEVKAVNNSDCIKVTWNSINGATSYRVYRKTYDEATKTWGEWDRLENGYKSTSYVDKKAMLSVSYKYTVRAVISEDVKSSYIATPVIKRNVTPVVKATNTNAGVNVTWNSVYGAQKYIVYRKTYNDTTKAWGSWEALINNCTATSYVDKTALLGERYKYTVVAVRNNFKSTFAETPLLQRNVAPAVTIAQQSNGIKVNWSSVYGAQKYTVYRQTYNATTKTWSSWEVIKSGCTDKSMVDTSVKNGTYYRYTVCGVRNNFQGSFVQSSVLQYIK